jgi:hypothetical protein
VLEGFQTGGTGYMEIYFKNDNGKVCHMSYAVYVYMCICVYVYMCICVYVYMCVCVYL